MKRCLVWGTGIEFINNLHLIQYYELSGLVQIVGITSNTTWYKSIENYKFIKKENIIYTIFDYLIVAATDSVLVDIQREAIEMGIDDSKIIPIVAMKLPRFEFDKYQKIKKNIPTIFAINCWGGFTYSSLGLEFKSPFINLFLNEMDYIKFLKNPQLYINSDLIFSDWGYSSVLKTYYPIAKCNDISLKFKHYKTYEEAVICWQRRKKRINWNNIFVMFFTENINIVHEFLSIPYANKICFVPFDYLHKEVISIPCTKGYSNIDFYKIVLRTASGGNIYYDIFELLLNHQIVPIVDTNR